MSKDKYPVLLTEKEREDVYKYWLHSSTLTNEDGLIQLAEKAVLEKLAGMELPEPELDVISDYGFFEYSQASIDAAIRQAFAQGAASVLSAEPVATVTDNFATDYSEIGRTYQKPISIGTPLYTLKAPK